jgi:outer membrane lipoprotein carrier protein
MPFDSSKISRVFPLQIVLLLLLALTCGAVTQTPKAIDVNATAQAIDEHYNRLKSFKASFAEIYQGGGINRNESGVLWLKKPGRMRWEYRQPREKLFLTDSQTAYFYVPGDHQARKAPIKRLDDIRSPLRYLLGKTKLQKELDGLSFAPDVQPLQPGDIVLRGIPKTMRDRVSELLLEVTPEHQIVRILIREVDGTSTDFRFSQIEENVAVQDALFHFTPPPGVEVLQDDKVAQ